VVLVGESAMGRKGQAWSTPRAILSQVDPLWAQSRVRDGLSSGEGVIFHVRNAREEPQPIKDRGRVVDYERVIVDHGEPDKRLLVIEPEFASVLRRMRGDTSSLSAVLRRGWDDGDLSTLTRNEPLRATGAHISIIAHITREELIINLTDVDRANGFANRFLFAYVTRSKAIPEPVPVPESDLTLLINELRDVVEFSRECGQVRRDADATALWAGVYSKLTEPSPGLLGAIIARGAPHVLRLSVLYAVLDRSHQVRPEHLKAALAIWDYALASAKWIFGDRLGHLLADTILSALKNRGPLARTDISTLFHRNMKATDIDAALKLLVERQKVRSYTQTPINGHGRPATVWEAL
jgi:hypothetical protein